MLSIIIDTESTTANGMTFDASSLTNGMITFDFKMLKAPDAGLVDWKFKVESSTGTNAEVNLATSVEGHATPLLDTWQTYSFPIATLVAAGLDAANIDLKYITRKELIFFKKILSPIILARSMN